MARVLGIDFGTKRIGVARSDPMGIIASPLLILESVGLTADVAAVARLGAAEEVEAYVIGVPIRLDGILGKIADRGEQFAQKLEAAVQVPVHRWDERWTTIIAERALRESNLSRQARKERRDAVAAAVILQSWLDHQPREHAESDE